MPSHDHAYTISADNRRLRLPDVFHRKWTPQSRSRGSSPALAPQLPLANWDVSVIEGETDLIEKLVPVLFGAPVAEVHEQSIRLGLDIFGTAFFMLSRCEELSPSKRDVHDRFPASASLACRAGFLDRPIVDEYVEILWSCMKRLWPNLQRKPRQGRMFVTCDVDEPYDYTLKSPRGVLKRVASDLLKRHSLREAVGSVRNAVARWNGNWSLDPYNTFSWMMDACERAGHQAAYFFIAGRSSNIDGEYDLDEPFIQHLLATIHRRGHEVGLHGSYNSFRDPSQLGRERRALQQACEMARVNQPIVGNRQHYLRWDSALSPASLEDAGIEYDTTGSFADAAGFRYGTAHSFPMWDWQKGRPSKVKQRPLIMMETSVMAPTYQALGHTDAALEKMLELKHRALRYGGEFVLLWHNSSLATEADRRMYRSLLGLGADTG